jgi:hypothetical protein
MKILNLLLIFHLIIIQLLTAKTNKQISFQLTQKDGKSCVAHTVSDNETILQLCKDFFVLPTEFTAFNDILLGQRLRPGQIVYIPLSSTNFTKDLANTYHSPRYPVYAKISKQLTTQEICQRFDLSEQAFTNWNPRYDIQQESNVVIGWLYYIPNNPAKSSFLPHNVLVSNSTINKEYLATTKTDILHARKEMRTVINELRAAEKMIKKAEKNTFATNTNNPRPADYIERDEYTYIIKSTTKNQTMPVSDKQDKTTPPVDKKETAESKATSLTVGLKRFWNKIMGNENIQNNKVPYQQTNTSKTKSSNSAVVYPSPSNSSTPKTQPQKIINNETEYNSTNKKTFESPIKKIEQVSSSPKKNNKPSEQKVITKSDNTQQSNTTTKTETIAKPYVVKNDSTKTKQLTSATKENLITRLKKFFKSEPKAKPNSATKPTNTKPSSNTYTRNPATNNPNKKLETTKPTSIVASSNIATEKPSEKLGEEVVLSKVEKKENVIHNEIRPLTLKNQKSGKCSYFFSGHIGGKFYAVTNLAPKGNIIKVTNTQNGHTIYAEVMSALHSTDVNKGILIKLSDNAKLPLQQKNNVFNVKVNY